MKNSIHNSIHNLLWEPFFIPRYDPLPKWLTFQAGEMKSPNRNFCWRVFTAPHGVLIDLGASTLDQIKVSRQLPPPPTMVFNNSVSKTLDSSLVVPVLWPQALQFLFFCAFSHNSPRKTSTLLRPLLSNANGLKINRVRWKCTRHNEE
jgi:hypothetical protein